MTDARNSQRRESTFFEACCLLCNDPEWIPSTEALPSLHPNFEKAIQCPIGNFTFTVNNMKQLFQKRKTALNEMLTRYENSGNGSNMLATDDENSDDDNEERGTGQTRQWGRFNSDRAKRVGDRKNMLLKDGNDRQSFLRHNPPWCMLCRD